jgi:hypothetical protein
MTRYLAAALAAALVLIAAAFAWTASAQETAGIAWETELAAANGKAAEKGRPLMVVFR